MDNLKVATADYTHQLLHSDTEAYEKINEMVQVVAVVASFHEKPREFFAKFIEVLRDVEESPFIDNLGKKVESGLDEIHRHLNE